MATEIINYQCPACTGPLHFAADSGRLECEYCGSSFQVSEVEALYAGKEEKAAAAQAAAEENGQGWDTSGLSDNWGQEGDKMRSYSCPSCGAQLICDESTAATACPYCGNPTVVPGQFAGTLRPDYVIPFRIQKEEAIAALKNHYKGKKFLPDAFTQDQQLEKIQGIYVPFWLFDGQADGSVEIDAHTISKIVTSSKETTITRYFRLERQGSIRFEKVPVDASTKMPDDYMDSIEPFDYQQLQPFSTAYLPGFLADKYDVDVEGSAARADQRCEQTFLDAVSGTASGYDFSTVKAKDIHITRGKVHYALLPVWLLHVNWSGEHFLFAVNGQSGKLVGNLPLDKTKMAITFAKIALPLTILFNLIVKFFIA